ncbi:uncharacterized protein si:dkeyp-75h12.7 isoform X1 [Antennarius striatus]|uniref:uncharacterized protein si:dkeyp-75h12.7 isoform X1 n=1 Tax=Antennarius striatus TaxID=241820 RepID=UPI0035AE890A
MIRLGVHLSPSATVWTEPRKFDYSDFTFSPPSVSVSLRGERLLVEVQYPCAASRRCSLETCCPISELIDPWTTVTVYNNINASESQSRTVWTQDAVTSVDFSGLAPGQNYCAVANFSFPTFSMAASSKSDPRCVETVSQPDLLPLLCVGIGLVSLVLVLLLTVSLWKTRRVPSSPRTRPKTPVPFLHLFQNNSLGNTKPDCHMSFTEVCVPDPVSLVPLSLVPVDLGDIYVEFADDQISMETSSSFVPLHRDSDSGATFWDSGGREMEGVMDLHIDIPPAPHDENGD